MYLGNLQALVEVQENSVESSLGLEVQSKVDHVPAENMVSFYAELPVALQTAMAGFIERYPNWDQYRLIQAALAGFLVQNGVESREITRLYVGRMFSRDSLIQGV